MATETTLERPLPQNLDAERSVLGAILLDNHALNAAIEKLKPEDFALDHHRRIFSQMIELGETQQAIDLVTLSDQLHRKGELEAAGGSRVHRATGGRRAARHAPGALRADRQRKGDAAQPDSRHARHPANGDRSRRGRRRDSGPRRILHLPDRRRPHSHGPGVDEGRGPRQYRAARARHHRGQADHGTVHRILAAGQPDVRPAAFGTDHPGGAALGGQDGAGAEHRGECRSATARAGGDLQPGNVQGIAADAASGVAGARGRAQVPHGPLVARGLAADDAIAGAIGRRAACGSTIRDRRRSPKSAPRRGA